jgi:hypothetical protein
MTVNEKKKLTRYEYLFSILDWKLNVDLNFKVKFEFPVMIRFGELTSDEFFVTEDAAKKGVSITKCFSYVYAAST